MIFEKHPRGAAVVRWTLWSLLAAALILQLGVIEYRGALQRPFRHDSGYAYWAALSLRAPFARGISHMPGEIETRLRLFEDGRPLPLMHIHEEIRREGHGRYSHWNRSVIFSASDNSDPNANGRTYSVRYPWLPHPAVVFGLVLLVLALEIGLAMRRARSRLGSVRGAVHRLTMATSAPVPPVVYWGALAALLGVGMALRGFWTYVYGLPATTADTLNYLIAASETPALPFSEMRTAGVPALLLLSVGIAGHPAGILLAHNLLWLVSTVAAALAVRRYLPAPLLSLAIAAYLAVSSKNLNHEYLLMSEHLSRVFYVLYFAAALYVMRHADERGSAALLAFLVFVNIVVKPSAVVLIVATLMLFAALAWRAAPGRRAILKNAGWFLGSVVFALAAYGFAYQQKYGKFGLSSFQGWNLFSHTGHLVDLDGPRYPEIKRELKEFMPLYISKYAASGQHQPNWLVYGSVPEGEFARDFGGRSPAEVIGRHARQQGGNVFALIDRIYLDLALEGIKAHPGEYAAYAVWQMQRLFREGWGFHYYEMKPSMRSLREHESSLDTYQQYFAPRAVRASTIGAQIEDCTTNFFVRSFCAALPDTSWYARYKSADLTRRVHAAENFYRAVSGPLAWTFDRLPAAALLFFPMALLPLAWRGPGRRHLHAALFLGLVLFGYALFLGLLNMAEPARFLANVQDLAVILLLCVIFAGALTLRALLAAAALRPRLLFKGSFALRKHANHRHA